MARLGGTATRGEAGLATPGGKASLCPQEPALPSLPSAPRRWARCPPPRAGGPAAPAAWPGDGGWDGHEARNALPLSPCLQGGCLMMASQSVLPGCLTAGRGHYCLQQTAKIPP